MGIFLFWEHCLPAKLANNAPKKINFYCFGALDTPANLVAELGNGWVREDVQWHRIQPSQNVRTLAARYGTKPIWVTEFGWGSGPCERDPQGRTNEEEQANYLIRAAAMLRGAGAERVLWYNYKDRNQPCYGLVRADGGDKNYSSLKPAAIALKTLNAQVGGASPLGPQNVMPSQVVLSFDDASGWGDHSRPISQPSLPALSRCMLVLHLAK